MKYATLRKGLQVGIHYSLDKRVPLGSIKPVTIRTTEVGIVLTRGFIKKSATAKVVQNIHDKDNKFLAKKVCLKRLFDTSNFPKKVRTEIWNWFLSNNTRGK